MVKKRCNQCLNLSKEEFYRSNIFYYITECLILQTYLSQTFYNNTHTHAYISYIIYTERFICIDVLTLNSPSPPLPLPIPALSNFWEQIYSIFFHWSKFDEYIYIFFFFLNSDIEENIITKSRKTFNVHQNKQLRIFHQLTHFTCFSIHLRSFQYEFSFSLLNVGYNNIERLR